MREMTCPICRLNNSELLRELKTDRLISEWNAKFGIDVREELQGSSVIQLHECRICLLRYFLPSTLAGPPRIYEALEKFEWYYMQDKWEHGVALEDLDDCENGVEVGCGFGDFVARAGTVKQIAFEGCEQNASAVKVAQARGLRVHLETLQGLANSRPAGYSAVCSFQVLEHLSDPRDFLNAACSLLRSGGKLMLGLPNAESFLRHQYNILDMPPHHMTRWTAEVLTRVQRWFPLKLLRIAYEPLADYHVDGYVEAYTGLLASKGLRFFAHPAFRSRTSDLIRKTGIQRLLRGQSIYACYVRT
jgi:SAM-dependent methyltransferase